MHNVIIVLISVVMGVAPLPTITQPPHKAESTHVTAALAPKPEEVKPEVAKPVVEKVLTWQDNPNNCDQNTQYIAESAPYNCIDKPVTPAPSAPASSTTTAVVAADDGSAKSFIYMHESGNNPGAINSSSGACGLGQALPCSKMPCSLSDYACQDSFFTSYMAGRYGTWENAKAFWLAHSWW